MSHTRKIKVNPAYQRVRWTTKFTSRGPKDKQVTVSTQKSRSAPTTPSRQARSPDEQQAFQDDTLEPLQLPRSTVSLFDLMLAGPSEILILLQSQNSYLQQFLERQRAHLHSLLKNEAPPPDKQCMSCNVRECNWNCLDCLGGAYQCSSCCLDRHKWLPFHRVEHWTSSHFQPAWLSQVGIEIHLGHNGNLCPSRDRFEMGARSGDGPDAGGSVHSEASSDIGSDSCDGEEKDAWVDDGNDDCNNELGLPKLQGEDQCVIVDKSGVHRLYVRPCLCLGCSPIDLQYLDMGLFPASLKCVRTAFTFAVLDDFRMDNLECKTAGMKYFNKLRRLTSNTFPFSVPASIHRDLFQPGY